jgi:hypothetical protein
MRIVLHVLALACVSRVAAADDVVGPRTETVRSRTHVQVSIGLAVVGTAAIATGLVLGLKAKSDYDDALGTNCIGDTSPPVCNLDGHTQAENARALGNVGTGFAIAGTAAVIAGAIVYITAPKEKTLVVPALSPSSVGVALTRSF